MGGVERNIVYKLLAKDESASKGLSKLAEHMKKVNGDMSGMQKAGIGAGAAVVAIGTAAIAFGKTSANKFVEVGREVLKLQRYTGDTAEATSRLRFAAKESGVDVDQLTKGIGKYSKTIAAQVQADGARAAKMGDVNRGYQAQIAMLQKVAKPTAVQAEHLKALSGKLAENQTWMASHAKGTQLAGIAFTDASGKMRPMNDVLLDTSAKLKGMHNGTEKTALVLKLFGKSGMELLPFLNRGAEGIKELEKQSDKLGNTMSAKDLQAVKENVKAHREFHAAMEGIQITIGRVVLPMLTKFTVFLNEHVMPPLLHFARVIAPMISGAFHAIGEVVGGIADAFKSGGLEGAVDHVSGMVSAALPKIGAALAGWGAAFVEWIRPRIPPMLAELGHLALEVGKWAIGTALPAIARQLAEWGAAFVKWIGPKIPPMLVELGHVIAAVGKWAVGTALPAIVHQLAEWGVALVKWVGPQIPPMLLELGKFLGKIVSWVTSEGIPKLEDKLGEMAVKGFSKVLSGIRAAWRDVYDWLKGLPGRIVDAIGDLGKTLLQAGKNVMGGLKDGIVEGFKDVASTLADITRKIPILKGPASRDAQLLYNNGVLIMAGLQKGLEDKFQNVSGVLSAMADRLKDSMKVGNVDAHLIAVLGAGTQKLAVLADRREKLSERFSAATEKLASMKADRASFIDSATSATTAGGNITGLGVDPESGQTTAAGIIAALKVKVDQATTFASNLVGLGKAGLSKQMIAQLASAGAEQASASAAALNLAGADAVKQANELQTQLQAAARKAAVFAGDDLYSTGIKAAQGLVAGLKSQQAAIEKQMLVIAKAMSASIKKALGIKSPSRLMHDEVGVMVGRGIDGGIRSTRRQIEETMGGLVGAPRAGRFAMAAAGGSAVVQQHHWHIEVAPGGETAAAMKIQQMLLGLRQLTGPLGLD